MQADLFDDMPNAPWMAPNGYFAVLKVEAMPADGSNICRACDWRPECQKPETDFARPEHRCMPCARDDGRSVLFKRLPANFVLGRLPCCVTSLLLHNITHRPTA